MDTWLEGWSGSWTSLILAASFFSSSISWRLAWEFWRLQAAQDLDLLEQSGHREKRLILLSIGSPRISSMICLGVSFVDQLLRILFKNRTVCVYPILSLFLLNKSKSGMPPLMVAGSAFVVCNFHVKNGGVSILPFDWSLWYKSKGFGAPQEI